MTKKNLTQKRVLLLLLSLLISCVQDDMQGWLNSPDANRNETHNRNGLLFPSKAEIMTFLKQHELLNPNNRAANDTRAEQIISPLHYVKLCGEQAQAGILQVKKEDKIAQWVFYKQNGQLKANRVHIIRKPGTQGQEKFTGIIQVSELYGKHSVSYIYKNNRLQRFYTDATVSYGKHNMLDAGPDDPTVEKPLSASPGPGDGDEKLDPVVVGGPDGGREDLDPVVVVGHPHSSSHGWDSGVSSTPGGGSFGHGESGQWWPGEPSEMGGMGTKDDPYHIDAVPCTGHAHHHGGGLSGVDIVPSSGGSGIAPAEDSPSVTKGLVGEEGEPVSEPKKDEPKKDKPCKTTAADLKKVFPHTATSTLNKIADLINQHAKDFGINSEAKLRFLISQAGVETDYMKSFHEYTNYRPSTVMSKFGAYFNDIGKEGEDSNKINLSDIYTKGNKFVDGEKLFNIIYKRSKTLGNIKSDDGWKYRGRGLLHLTGRYNYSQFTKFYQKQYGSSKDFVAHPELLNDDKEIGVISGLWYFQNRVANHKLTGDTNIDKVSKLINGGNNGRQQRRNLYKSIKEKNIKCH